MVINPFKIRNKDRLLYYFYKRKEIHEDEFIKSKIMRKIGYKSSGQFDRDFKELMNKEFIIFDKQKRTYKITIKGERELFFFIYFEIIALLLSTTGFLLTCQALIQIFGIQINPYVILFPGLSLLAVGIMTYSLTRKFKKAISQPEKKFSQNES